MKTSFIVCPLINKDNWSKNIKMSREKKLFNNTLILTFGTIIPKLSSLVTLPIITAELTKAQYGTYDLINILATLFLPIATLQIQAAAFRYLIEMRGNENKKKEIITNIFIFIVTVSAIALLALFLILRNISNVMKILICIYFLVDTLISAARQVTRGLSFNKKYSLSAVINCIINLILILVLISWKNYSLLGLLIATIVPLLIALCYLIVSCKLYSFIDLRLISKSVIKEMLLYSWPMVPNSLSSWVMTVSDRLVVTYFLGIEVNAIYAIANKLPSLFIMIQGTFSLAWQENASLAVNDSDNELYYNKMFDSIFSILVGVMAILIATTPILFFILIKGNYQEAYYQIPILYMGVFFASLASFLAGIYIANKETKKVGLSTTLAAICNFLIDICFINIIGLYAASISTMVSYMILFAYRMYDIQKFQTIKYNLKKIILSVMLLGFMCVICYKQSNVLNIINILLGGGFAFIMNRSLLIGICKFIYIKINKKTRE